MHADVSSASPAPSHAAFRIVAVAALVLFWCVFHLPDLSRVLGHPLGDWNFQTDGHTVLSVVPGGAADRAGLKVGDRVDLLSLGFGTASVVFSGFAVEPQQVLHLNVLRANRTRQLTIRANPENPSDYPLIILREIAFLLVITTGAALLLLRPSLTTWGFFLYSQAAVSAPTAVSEFRIFPGSDVFTVMGFIAGNLSDLGLVLFALSLSHRSLRGWRGACLVIAVALAITRIGIGLRIMHVLSTTPSSIEVATSMSMVVVALIGLLDAYLTVGVRFRQRLQWIGLGLLATVAASLTDAFLWPHFESYAVHSALGLVPAAFAAVAAYAILRERVVDITFAVSRTVVYALLTTGVVAIFALIDLFLSRVLERAGLSLPIDIVAALVLGFSFNGVHKRVDASVDRVLFRQRYTIEKQLRQAARAVLHVNAAQTVAHFLVRLPAELLDLSCAAVYRKTTANHFALEDSTGECVLPARFDIDDPLVVYASAELAPIRISDVPMRDRTLVGADRPVLAMPLLLRRQLVGFVLYGAHRNGADLDSDEERALSPLVDNAMVTYDHLEAQALREEVQHLRTLHPVPV